MFVHLEVALHPGNPLGNLLIDLGLMALKTRGAFAIVGVGAKRLILVVTFDVVVHGHVAYGVAEAWLLMPDEKARRGKDYDRCDASDRDRPLPANPTLLRLRFFEARLGRDGLHVLCGAAARRLSFSSSPISLSPLFFASLKFLFCYISELYAAHYITHNNGRK